MKGSVSWTESTSDFHQQLDSFKENTSDADTITKKLDLLLAEYINLDDKSQLELKYLIISANLPSELSKLLLNKVGDQLTQIIQQDASSIPASQTEHSSENDAKAERPHSSSSLKDLLQWDASQQSNSIKPGQIIRSTYCLDFKIGSGGMGEVWKALDLLQDAGEAKDKYVAIKFINQEIKSHPYALKALVREFARYKKLIHPNIVKAYELNSDDNEIFIVMEYLDGGSLQEFIRLHQKGISLQQAQPIIKAMCDALECAHNEGIVHLDFKPGNVLLNPRTKICKVIDFGIARLSNREERDKTLFDPGSLGAMTTNYASSEMLMKAEPDPRDDVYGLACVIYELLSGHHPFYKTLSLEAERKNMQPKQITGLNQNEIRALRHGLSFHRDNRSASAKELYTELFPTYKKPTIQKLAMWPIIAAVLVITPFVIYEGYNNWQKNQVKIAIQQKSDSGLEGFISLSLNEQKELMNDHSLRLALVKYTETQKDSTKDVLSVIEQFDPKIQLIIFADRKVRAHLISYYNDEIDHATKEDSFQLAEQLFLRIAKQYPDSMLLIRQSRNIEPQKAKRLAALQKNYQQCLQDNSKNLTELFPCIQETRTILSKIDSKNDLLSTPNLTNRYRVEVSSALSVNNLSLAKTLLANWHILEKDKNDYRTLLEQELSRLLSVSEPEKINQEIVDLLNQAERQLAKKQLMTPANDSAWSTYQKVLMLEPGNKQALKGVDNITQTYILWAKEEIKKENFEHAKYLFDKALQVSPDNKGALSGLSSLESKRKEQEPLMQTINNNTDIFKLLNKAEQQFENDQLIEPIEDNAWNTYQQILSIDPNNRQALIGINKIGKTYIVWAWVEIRKNNLQQAESLFKKALEVTPDSEEAISGLDWLANEKQQNQQQSSQPPIESSSENQTSNNAVIAKLLKKARQQFSKKQLINPAKDNAWITYKKILSLDPDNKQALAGIDNITKTYVKWGKEEIVKGNYKRAGHFFNKALEVSPGDSDALAELAWLISIP